MKRHIKWLLTVLMVFMMVSFIRGNSAKADTTEDGHYQYSISSDNEVTKYGPVEGYKPEGVFEVPEKINGMNVVSIDGSLCQDLVGVTKVVIPRYVRKFEYSGLPVRMFSVCINLQEIEVDSNNQYFSSISGVLYDKKIKTVICYPQNKLGDEYKIPSTIERIEEGAIVNNRVKHIYMEDSVLYIGEMAFCADEKLESIKFSKNIRFIGADAFYNCTELKGKIDLENVKYLGIGAFCMCNKIESVSIPKIIKINSSCFYKCCNLKDITLGNEVKELGCDAFCETDIKTLHIPQSVSVLEAGALEEMKSLSKLIFHSKVFIDSDYYRCPEWTTKINHDTLLFYDPTCDFSKVKEPIGISKIIGHSDSTAQSFAQKENIVFESFSLELPRDVSLLQAEQKKIEISTNTEGDITWVSNDSSVVTVDESGILKGKKPGTTQVTASVVLGGIRYESSSEVSVQPNGDRMDVPEASKQPSQPINTDSSGKESATFNGISVNTDKIVMDKGKQIALPSVENKTDQTLVYRVANQKIAQLTKQGKIQGKSIGTTKLIIETDDGKYKVELKLVVKGITVNKSIILTKKGSKSKLRIKENVPGKVKFRVKNNKIVSITKAGEIKAKKVGVTNIVIFVGRYQEVCRVQVGRIRLKKTTLSIKRGGSKKIQVIQNTTGMRIKYKSLNANIASISKDGRIQAKRKGTVKIRVMTCDNKIVTVCTVKVKS
ncbi:cell surface protein [Lachnospiraceae bacterium KM106-2]|nr:cell surface protein [Lachnospiraceae bacterium KM106-2]